MSDGGSSSIAAPVIAGLAVGVAFVILFTFLFHDSIATSSAVSQRKFHMDISIEGLKNSYLTDQKIDFTIRAKGYGMLCGYPIVKLINTDTNEVIKTINNTTTDASCDPTSYDFDETWTLAELLPKLNNNNSNNLSIDEVGHYKVVATHVKIESERAFVVVNGGYSDGKTFCTSPRFQLSNMTAQNVKGDSIRQASIGSTVLLKADVKSNCKINNYPILISFGVLLIDGNNNSNGNNNIIFHSQQNVTMSYGQQITATSLWKPDKAGNYEIVVLLATCLHCSSDYGNAQRYNFAVTSYQ